MFILSDAHWYMSYGSMILFYECISFNYFIYGCVTNQVNVLSIYFYFYQVLTTFNKLNNTIEKG